MVHWFGAAKGGGSGGREGEKARYEAVQLEAARRHEELLRLFSSQPSRFSSTSRVTIGEEEPGHGQQGGSATLHNIRDNQGQGILPTLVRPPELFDENPPYWAARLPQQQNYTPYLKLNFSVFSGEDPEGWLENCEQYFDIY